MSVAAERLNQAEREVTQRIAEKGEEAVNEALKAPAKKINTAFKEAKGLVETPLKKIDQNDFKAATAIKANVKKEVANAATKSESKVGGKLGIMTGEKFINDTADALRQAALKEATNTAHSALNTQNSASKPKKAQSTTKKGKENAERQESPEEEAEPEEEEREEPEAQVSEEE